MAWLQAQAAWAQAASSLGTVGEPRWRGDPFALGVASGEPRPDSVLLWTRLYPGPAQPGQSASDEAQRTHFEEKSGIYAGQRCIVGYEIFADEALSKRVMRGTVATDAGRGWSVHVRVRT